MQSLRQIWWRLYLPPKHGHILQALKQGATLKAHRDLNGQKVFCLHTLSGRQQEVSSQSVLSLFDKQLIYTNHKFPANTYLLTQKGKEVAGNSYTALSPLSTTQ